MTGVDDVKERSLDDVMMTNAIECSLMTGVDDVIMTNAIECSIT